MRPHDGSAGGGYSEKLPQGGVVFQNGVAARIPLYRQQGTEFGTCFYPLGPRNTTKLNYTQGSPYAFSVARWTPWPSETSSPAAASTLQCLSRSAFHSACLAARSSGVNLAST